MSYLNFNKEELVNLEYSLKREVLSTNRAGGYSSTTVDVEHEEISRATCITYLGVRGRESCITFLFG